MTRKMNHMFRASALQVWFEGDAARLADALSKYAERNNSSSLLNPGLFLARIPPLERLPSSGCLIILPTDCVRINACRNPDGRMP
jgi:hypothetical protein